jgi:pimeloyl-ACP methyl ester carboxylesterase
MDKSSQYNGGSYGGTAALIYILRHGEHIRTAAATSSDVPIFERRLITSQRPLELMFARCTVPEDICAAMPQPRAEALYGPLTNSAVPVLLFNDEADPQDAPETVANATQRYPNSLLLVAPGQAHGSTGIPCRASLIADLFSRGSVDGLSTQCLDQVELPAFVK